MQLHVLIKQIGLTNSQTHIIQTAVCLIPFTTKVLRLMPFCMKGTQV